MITLLFTIFLTTNAVAYNIFDGSINFSAHKIFNQKVNKIYKQALACSPHELDQSTGKTVNEWMAMEPAIPDWRMLKDLQKVAYESRDYAQKKIGTDKVLHCFAGCYIRQKLDLKSALMVGWLKELSDASDCSTSTHFEQSDYYATAAGAIAGKKNSCDSFCSRDDVINEDGNEMLRIAKRENSL